MEKIRIEKEIEVTGEYDLLVAGGGVAGVAAAVTASRMGKKVLLIEKTITLGGLGTIGLVNFYEPICNGRGTVVMKGLAQEMLELSIKKSYDTLPSEWKDLKGPGESATTRFETGYSVNIFIIQLTKWLKDENVDILFDTVVTQPVMEGGKCVGLVVENKTGTQFYKGKMVIDATGDADVMERAGMPTELGKNYHTFYASVTDLESCQNAIDKQDIHEIYAKKLWPGRSNMLGWFHPEDVPFWTPTAEHITDYVVRNHVDLIDSLNEEDRMTRDITELPHMPQFRTSRRLIGDYTFTTDDVYKHFEDSVGVCCDFSKKHYIFEIPYGVIHKEGFDNILAAGRVTSGGGWGWDILRVIPPCIATGQAAGAAASIAIDDNVAVNDVDIKKLQDVLTNQGVDIHFDDKLVDRELAPEFECGMEKK